jgi:hypothetical protein
VGWFTIRNHKREAAIVAILAIVFILGVGYVVMKLKSDPTEAEPLIPSPTFTPVITPTSTPMLPTSTPQPPTSTPAPTPTATPIPSYSLTINGVTVQQGQNIVHEPVPKFSTGESSPG